MKLIITLLVLSLASYIRAATQVYTLFTLTGGDNGCVATNGLVYVDTCSTLCSTENFIQVKYNFATKNYTASVYGYKSCASQLQNTFEFDCSSITEVAGYNLSCTNQVTLTKFDSFKVSIQDCQDSILKINTCSGLCNDEFFGQMVPAPLNVNGYFFAGYNTMEECNKTTVEVPTRSDDLFQCLNNEATVKISESTSYVCYAAANQDSSSTSSTSSTDNSDSSSSVVAYSMTLLISIILLNLLF